MSTFLDRTIRQSQTLQRQLREAQAALRRVHDLHQAGPDGTCTHCGHAEPCPTQRIMRGEQ